MEEFKRNEKNVRIYATSYTCNGALGTNNIKQTIHGPYKCLHFPMAKEKNGLDLPDFKVINIWPSRSKNFKASCFDILVPYCYLLKNSQKFLDQLLINYIINVIVLVKKIKKMKMIL